MYNILMMNQNYNQVTLWLKVIVLSFFIGCSTSSKKKNIQNESHSDIDSINQLISQNPTNAHLFYSKAKLIQEKEPNNLKAVFDNISKAISLDSTQSDYFYVLSDVYFKRNNTRKAKESLEQSIALNPQNTKALLSLAELHLFVKNYEESIGYLNKILNSDQYNPNAYFMKGMIYKEMGDTSASISCMEKAVAYNQNYYHAYIQLGMLYGAQKNEMAVAHFNNALNIDPLSIEAYYALALYYQDTEQINQALETYTRLLEIDSSYSFAYYNMGYIQMVMLSVYDVAKNNFDRAVRYQPDYVDAIYMRGYSSELLGDVNAARADYNKALTFFPEHQLSLQGIKRIENISHVGTKK